MRRSRFYADVRFRLWMFWHRTDPVLWGFAALLAVIVATFAFTLRAVFAYQDEKRDLVRGAHQRNLECLARNVYFEARGEPLAGQYAVAEVTMNRRASRRFPRTVCEVVYQQNWDPLRERYVGAFSWTELDSLPEPEGEHWQRAREVAEAVYYGRQPPVLRGALFYHANYIRPDWAPQKERVAQIGRHIFYR
jgi:N-acetylmuramoyl-L-alanine amidase